VVLPEQVNKLPVVSLLGFACAVFST